MILPPEVLGHILKASDTQTISTLRTTCKSMARLIDSDISLSWHGDKLRHSLGQLDSHWAALALLAQYAGVVQAAPSNSPYFKIYVKWDRPRVHTLLAAHMRWLDARLQHIHLILGEDCEKLISKDGLLSGLRCVESITLEETSVDNFGHFPSLQTLQLLDADLLEIPTGLAHLRITDAQSLSTVTPEIVRTLRVFEAPIQYASDITLGRFLRDYPMPLLRELCIDVLRFDMIRTKLRLPPSLTHLSIKIEKTITGAKNGENLRFTDLPNLQVLRISGNGIQGLGLTIWPPQLRVLHLAVLQIKELIDVPFPDTLEKLYVRDTSIPPNSPIGRLPPTCKVIRDFRSWMSERAVEKAASRRFYFD